jgi:hypothetical protein
MQVVKNHLSDNWFDTRRTNPFFVVRRALSEDHRFSNRQSLLLSAVSSRSQLP